MSLLLLLNPQPAPAFGVYDAPDELDRMSFMHGRSELALTGFPIAPGSQELAWLLDYLAPTYGLVKVS